MPASIVAIFSPRSITLSLGSLDHEPYAHGRQSKRDCCITHTAIFGADGMSEDQFQPLLVFDAMNPPPAGNLQERQQSPNLAGS
jgi:hypothetical protein